MKQTAPRSTPHFPGVKRQAYLPKDRSAVKLVLPGAKLQAYPKRLQRSQTSDTWGETPVKKIPASNKVTYRDSSS